MKRDCFLNLFCKIILLLVLKYWICQRKVSEMMLWRKRKVDFAFDKNIIKVSIFYFHWDKKMRLFSKLIFSFLLSFISIGLASAQVSVPSQTFNLGTNVDGVWDQVAQTLTVQGNGKIDWTKRRQLTIDLSLKTESLNKIEFTKDVKFILLKECSYIRVFFFYLIFVFIKIKCCLKLDIDNYY